MLKLENKQTIKKISNQTYITGEVNGCEIQVDENKKWTYDLVSFMVDGEMFVAKKSSSPYRLTSRSDYGDTYDVIYDKNCPSNNIIVDNVIFQEIRNLIEKLSRTYVAFIIIGIISYMFMH
jgi:hypothetical protein